jgi:hypothetical protein
VNVLIDANVVFDVSQRRQPYYAASLQVMQMARHGELSAAIAAITIANGYYIFPDDFAEFARKRLLADVEVCCGDAFTTKLILESGFKDLEDALQTAAAVAWKSSFIISRNVRDFKLSPIPALTPAEFLRRFKRREL